MVVVVDVVLDGDGDGDEFTQSFLPMTEKPHQGRRVKWPMSTSGIALESVTYLPGLLRYLCTRSEPIVAVAVAVAVAVNVNARYPSRSYRDGL